MEDKFKKVGCKLTEIEHRAFKSESAKRGITVGEAIKALIGDWLRECAKEEKLAADDSSYNDNPHLHAANVRGRKSSIKQQSADRHFGMHDTLEGVEA